MSLVHIGFYLIRKQIRNPSKAIPGNQKKTGKDRRPNQICGPFKEIRNVSGNQKKTGEGRRPIQGIPNLGNTCYMNAVIQVLCRTPNFREQLQKAIEQTRDRISQQTSRETWSFTLQYWKQRLLSTIIPSRFQTRFLVPPPPQLDRPLLDLVDAVKSESHVSSALPQAVLNVICQIDDEFKGYGQQDSYQLFNTMIEGLENLCEVKRTDNTGGPVSDLELLMNNSPISRLFGGVFCTIYTYSTCDHIEPVFQRFTSISVHIPPQSRKGSTRNKMEGTETQTKGIIQEETDDKIDRSQQHEKARLQTNGSSEQQEDESQANGSPEQQEDEDQSNGSSEQQTVEFKTSESLEEQKVGFKTNGPLEQHEDESQTNGSSEQQKAGFNINGSPKQEEDEHQTNRSPQQQEDEHQTNRSPKQQEDEHQTNRSPKQQEDEHQTNRSPKQQEDEHQTNRSPKQQEDEHQTNRSPKQQEDEHQTNGSPEHQADEHQTNRSPQQQEDEHQTNRSPQQQEDEHQANRSPKQQEDEHQSNRSPKQQEDEHQANRSPKQQEDEHQTNGSPEHQADEHQTNRSPQQQEDEHQTNRSPQQQEDEPQANRSPQQQEDEHQTNRSPQQQADEHQSNRSPQQQEDEHQANGSPEHQADEHQSNRSPQQQEDEHQANGSPQQQADEGQCNGATNKQEGEDQTKGPEQQREDDAKTNGPTQQLETEGHNNGSPHQHEVEVQLNASSLEKETDIKPRRSPQQQKADVQAVWQPLKQKARDQSNYSAASETPRCYRCLKNEQTDRTDLEEGLKMWTDIDCFQDLPCRTCEKSCVKGANDQTTITRSRILLMSLPPVLVLQFNRFTMSLDGSLEKMDGKLTYPEYLDAAPYCSAAVSFLNRKNGSDTDEYQYRLYGVVSHMGSIRGGHYTAHVRTTEHQGEKEWRDPQRYIDEIISFLKEMADVKTIQAERKDTWYTISDDRVEKDQYNTALCDPNAYLLFYERV
ncbi:uncharacterized protein LOC117327645 isoform X3 [Pecten maximus]|uniref:uncharacterized protein LOC117327645 isoform X3 n=1 Tax=Pecten maximus TaxID=6579 RepID=UPI00145844FD|nr:uncharacterized protein LOC117327645 isoform X3 [Pecten maximus]